MHPIINLRYLAKPEADKMAFPIIPILKKVAVTLVTDKKARKVILGIVLGIIFVILMPIIAVYAQCEAQK